MINTNNLAIISNAIHSNMTAISYQFGAKGIALAHDYHAPCLHQRQIPAFLVGCDTIDELMPITKPYQQHKDKKYEPSTTSMRSD
jgi:hypothetical protein